MEASAIQAGPGLGRPRITLGTPLLRLRSDQQLVALFREGHEEAFRVIHDRYRPRLLAYLRQMLPGRAADAEDALQDVFVRTYAGLRTSSREVALRPWLYRVAHNRCIDELRRPHPLPELLEARDRISDCDPAAETERRESLRRLVIDIGRLPDQQRSALLMREMSGMAYADVACALAISVPAVKSLLVRARIGLAQSIEARDAACADIRLELAEAHEGGVRPSWMARRHLRDCAGCRACRSEIRTQSRRVAALAPTVAPFAVLAKLFGVGTGAGGGTATAASAGGATAGAGGTLTAASGLATVTVGHVATILAAAVVTAGGAVAVQTVAASSPHHAKHAILAVPAVPAADPGAMRVPALIPSPPPATHRSAAPVRQAPPAAAPSTAGGASRWHGQAIPHLPPATPSDVATATGSGSSGATSNTCMPPPPPACTASQTTTCSTGSGSTTSSDAQTATTAQTTTTTGQTTTTTGSSTTTTSGSTSGTTSSTAAGTSASACSSTAQPTSTEGAGSTGTGSTGTGQTGTTEPVKQT